MPAMPALSASSMRPLPVSPTIDDPMALLRACHDKVRHFCQLAQRLQAHVRVHGADASAREAAQAVRRYFTLAAPLHHADEEEDLFVALRALGEARLSRDIDELAQEHAELSALWDGVLPWLDALAEGRLPGGAEPDVDAFAGRYQRHAQREEDAVYPHATRLSPQALRQLADAMVARRSPSPMPPMPPMQPTGPTGSG